MQTSAFLNDKTSLRNVHNYVVYKFHFIFCRKIGFFAY